jgi:hypothetical protein
MSAGPVNKYVQEVRALIDARLRVRGRTLEQQLKRAGRLLPAAMQREGRYLVQAETFMDHPKLGRMIDAAKVETAHRRLVAHLKSIDPAERRKTRLLGIAGVISFNLIVVSGALIGWLVWRGYV